MNIFFLNRDPKKAAVVQYNKHVVKMILESAQMLCTAHHAYNNGHNVPYKKAHLNHPSTVWVRQNSRHYYWLFDHMIALGNEYTKRYGKTHLSITKCFDSSISLLILENLRNVCLMSIRLKEIALQLIGIIMKMKSTQSRALASN